MDQLKSFSEKCRVTEMTSEERRTLSETPEAGDFIQVLENQWTLCLQNGDPMDQLAGPMSTAFKLNLVEKRRTPYLCSKLKEEEIVSYAEKLVSRLDLKIISSQVFKNVELEPYFAAFYAFVVITDQYADNDNGGVRVVEKYLELTTAPWTLEFYGGWEGTHSSELFASTIMYHPRISRILAKRLSSRQFKSCLTDKDVEKSLLRQSLKGVAQAVKGVEHWLQKGAILSEYGVDLNELLEEVVNIGNLLEDIGLKTIYLEYIGIIEEMGVNIVTAMQETELLAIVKRLLTYTPSKHTAIAASNAARVIGKMASVPRICLSSSLLGLIIKDGFVHLKNPSEAKVFSNWLWAFGEFTQGLVAADTLGMRPNINILSELVILLQLLFVSRSIKVHDRYTLYRSFGNVVKCADETMDATAPERSKLYNALSQLVPLLLKQLGEGRNYKNRWNSAYGLGCIFQCNEMIDFLINYVTPSLVTAPQEKSHSLLAEIVINLSFWSFKSQNFKERIQCLIALQKIETRAVVTLENTVVFQTVLTNVSKGIHHMPSEVSEESDMKTRYLTEVVITLCKLIILLGPEEMSFLQHALSPFVEDICRAMEVIDTQLAGSNNDILMQAHDRLTAVMKVTSCQGDHDNHVVHRLVSALRTVLSIEIGGEDFI